MTKYRISDGSYEKDNKWVSAGVLLISNGGTDQDIKLGPSEAKFSTQEAAKNYLFVLSRKRCPALFRLAENRKQTNDLRESDF